MEVIELEAWDDFERFIVETLPEKLKKYESGGEHGYVSRPLFRGLPDAEWKLETTLERWGMRDVQVKDYYITLLEIKPYLETFTDREWVLPSVNDVKDDWDTSPTGYDLMVYARHHGFPSPLLDWTESPYIAAFFAFNPARSDSGKPVSILAYVEHVGSGKFHAESDPAVRPLGRFVRAHRRHFLQQSRYTVCRKRGADGVVIYSSHEDAFQARRPELMLRQDILFKVTLPSRIRDQVVAKLASMNINPYSLFGDEYGLLGMLANRFLKL